MTPPPFPPLQPIQSDAPDFRSAHNGKQWQMAVDRVTYTATTGQMISPYGTIASPCSWLIVGVEAELFVPSATGQETELS